MWREIRKRLSGHERRGKAPEPAAVLEIKNWEKTIGFSLPEDYRTFLTEISNGGDFFDPGFQIYGVSGGAGNGCRLDEVNDKDYRGWLRIPESYYIIGAESSGSFVCLDRRDGTVVEWDRKKKVEHLRFDSFLAWLNQNIAVCRAWEEGERERV